MISKILLLITLVLSANANINNYKSSIYCEVKRNNLFINKKNSNFTFRYNLCYSKQNKYKDVRISAEFKSISGSIDKGGGIAWRIQDEYNYYVVRFNPLENNFRLYYVKNGNRVELQSENLKLENKYNKITIEHKNNNIKAYINDKLLLTYNDDTFKKDGYIGVWSKADASTLFKNIIVIKQ